MAISNNIHIDSFNALSIPEGRGICYSGYREGQSPDIQNYPTRDQIREDLHIVKDYWQYVRLYDCSEHAEKVLDLIKSEGLELKVMLGAFIGAEVNNYGCRWGGV